MLRSTEQRSSLSVTHAADEPTIGPASHLCVSGIVGSPEAAQVNGWAIVMHTGALYLIDRPHLRRASIHYKTTCRESRGAFGQVALRYLGRSKGSFVRRTYDNVKFTHSHRTSQIILNAMRSAAGPRQRRLSVSVHSLSSTCGEGCCREIRADPWPWFS